MTWTWKIDSSDPTAQILTVHGPDGSEVGSITQESFSWVGDHPDAVEELMPETIEALIALQRDDIECRS